MKKAELLRQLRQAISPAEWEALEQSRLPAPVGAFNRGVLLEMQNAPAPADGEVSNDRVTGLYETLRAYLAEYMEEQPLGWKYVILASLYLAFLAGRPMHPVSMLKIQVTETNSGIVYQCPQKSSIPGTACDYCVCRRLER